MKGITMTAPTAEVVISTLHDDGVLELVINRPDRMNALSTEVKDLLQAGLLRASSDPAVTAVLLRGEGGRSFAAGQDLGEAAQFTAESVGPWIDSFYGLYTSILECTKPTIAGVDGFALGAGFQVAMLCDIRIASDAAKFAMPEVDDAIPCITGTWTLYDIIGHARTADMVLTGRFLSAEEAAEWGLVRDVVPQAEFHKRALELASLVGSKPTIAVQMNKRFLVDLLNREWPATESFARKAHKVAFASDAPQARMRDFLAHKRDERMAY